MTDEQELDDENDNESGDDVAADQTAESTGVRWFDYKRLTLAAGREPMTWGDWLHAGQPVPIVDER